VNTDWKENSELMSKRVWRGISYQIFNRIWGEVADQVGGRVGSWLWEESYRLMFGKST